MLEVVLLGAVVPAPPLATVVVVDGAAVVDVVVVDDDDELLQLANPMADMATTRRARVRRRCIVMRSFQGRSGCPATRAVRRERTDQR
jgi:hypothetical protein